MNFATQTFRKPKIWFYPVDIAFEPSKSTSLHALVLSPDGRHLVMGSM